MRRIVGILLITVAVLGAFAWALSRDDGAQEPVTAPPAARNSPEPRVEPPRSPVEIEVRATRADPAGVSAVVRATRSGRIRLMLLRGERIVAQSERLVRAGPSRMRVDDDLPSGPHVLLARIRTADGASAADEARVFVAPRLSIRTAIRLMGGRRQGGEETVSIELTGRCKAFGPRRVDCERRLYGLGYENCDAVVSLRLRRNGIPLKRTYRCGDPLFQRTPRRWRPDQVLPD